MAEPLDRLQKHGSFLAYNYYKCRCQDCRDYMAEYMRGRRKAEKLRDDANKASR
jgi:hypothetical protein